MFNGAELLANEQTAFSKHNMLMRTVTWITPALTSTAAEGSFQRQWLLAPYAN